MATLGRFFGLVVSSKEILETWDRSHVVRAV